MEKALAAEKDRSSALERGKAEQTKKWTEAEASRQQEMAALRNELANMKQDLAKTEERNRQLQETLKSVNAVLKNRGGTE